MLKTIARSARARSLSLPLRAPLFALALGGVLAGSCAATDDTADQMIGVPWQGFAGVPQQGDVLGAASAPVTLEEFADLRCSHCRDFDEDTLPVLVERYVRAGKLRIVFHNLPILGPASVDAARMAPGGVSLDDKGFVLTDIDLAEARTRPLPFQTSVESVFAIGDVRSGSTKRVASAVGEGAGVVAQIHRFMAGAR